MIAAHEMYMQRCLQLATLGIGYVAPNPMVGCVIVYQNKIVAEGYHQEYGKQHAEVNAINNVADKSILQHATLYVNLEPCAHYGKTPPCVNLILEHKIKKVVVGCTDIFSKVNGAGIKILQQAGIEVLVGILEKECKILNKRFFTFHERKRPYIILKWAQSANGYIGKKNVGNFKISNSQSQAINHLWRTQEQAILIGSNTAIIDNPSLTARLANGNNPKRFIIDLEDKLPKSLTLLNDENETYVFTKKEKENINNTTYLKVEKSENCLSEIMQHFYVLNIQSVIVEGGAITLQHFIDESIWDEAIIFQSKLNIENGVDAPQLKTYILTNEIVTENSSENKNVIQFFKPRTNE